MRQVVRDVVFVGGGYRTVSFLAGHPEILRHDTEVIEASSTFGAGAFADYHCVSTSASDRFLRGVAPQVAAAARNPARLAALSREPAGPIALTELAQILAELGEVLETHPDLRARVRRGCVVRTVRVGPDRVDLTLDSGEVVATRHAVLATGREERPHPELARWRHKTVLSADLISVRHTPTTCALLEQATGPVVVAGGSHSAMAALLRLLELRRATGRDDLPLVMLRRSPARLHYASLAHAHAERDGRYEPAVDPVADVCPATGQVNRDSGLRGQGRATLRALATGTVANARIETCEVLAEHGHLLDAASVVVQALGYHGRAPSIVLPDGTSRPVDSPEPLVNLADGTAVIGARPVERLSVLRVEPTPLALRDHGLYGQGMYPRLAMRLQSAVGVPDHAA
jgi:hypothetical protein